MKNFKKLYAVLMLVSFIFATVSPAFAGGLAKISDIAGGNGGMAVGEKSTIYFGRYWQTAASGYTPTGTFSEPEAFIASYWNKESIKWRVLSNDGGKMFLLSDRALYADAFDSSSNVWGNSEICATLNNTTAGSGFAGDAFSAAELAAIAETTHIAGGRENYAGCDTASTEKIFLLSDEEVNNTAYGFEEQALGTVTTATAISNTRKPLASEMAKHVVMYGNTSIIYGNIFNNGMFLWWLRSPGEANDAVYFVSDTGGVFYNGLVYNAMVAVRPALNLKQEDVLFASAAEGGKKTVNAGDGFAMADYDGSKGWKLTLKDTSITAPAVTAENNGKKLSVTYSGVKTGTDMYLSALLYNEAGKLINYTKVAEAETKGEGTAEISLENLPSGKYRVNFCTEQANGDKQTDYASELGGAVDVTIGWSGGSEKQSEEQKQEEQKQEEQKQEEQKQEEQKQEEKKQEEQKQEEEKQEEQKQEEKKSSSDSGGGGGCNAGFGALALLPLAGLALRKKKSKFRR